MNERTKIVKGGFRATLALILSIAALVLSIMAYNRTAEQSALRARIQKFETKMDVIRKETRDHVGKIRQETGQILERMGKSIKKEDKESQESRP